MEKDSKENYGAARNLFQDALKLDPENADALAGMAYMDMVYFSYGWAEPGIDYATRVISSADRAIASHAGNGMAYFAKGMFLAITNRSTEAIATGQAGIERYPNHALLYVVLSTAQISLGHYEQAKGYLEQAIKLSPRDPYTGVMRMQLGQIQMGLGHYDAAIELLYRSINPKFSSFIPHMILAATYALANRKEEASAAPEF